MYNTFYNTHTGINHSMQMDALPRPGELVCESLLFEGGRFNEGFRVRQVIHTGPATAIISIEPCTLKGWTEK